MCSLSSKKPRQKRIMGRWKRKEGKSTCWLSRWNVQRKQETAISILFNGVFSPIHNWKCVYCFIFPLWEGVTNLILHIKNQLMVLIMHQLTLFLNRRMGQSKSPHDPGLCKQVSQTLVPCHWPLAARWFLIIQDCWGYGPESPQWNWNGVTSKPCIPILPI